MRKKCAELQIQLRPCVKFITNYNSQDERDIHSAKTRIANKQSLDVTLKMSLPKRLNQSNSNYKYQFPNKR